MLNKTNLRSGCKVLSELLIAFNTIGRRLSIIKNRQVGNIKNLRACIKHCTD